MPQVFFTFLPLRLYNIVTTHTHTPHEDMSTCKFCQSSIPAAFFWARKSRPWSLLSFAGFVWAPLSEWQAEGPGCKQKLLYAVYMCTSTILMHGTRPAGVKRLRAEELVRPAIGEMHASDERVPCPHLPTGRMASTCAGAFRHIRQGCRLEAGGRERCDPKGTDLLLLLLLLLLLQLQHVHTTCSITLQWSTGPPPLPTKKSKRMIIISGIVLFFSVLLHHMIIHRAPPPRPGLWKRLRVRPGLIRFFIAVGGSNLDANVVVPPPQKKLRWLAGKWTTMNESMYFLLNMWEFPVSC